MNKLINIISYKGLPRRAAEMALTVCQLANGSYAQFASGSSDILRELVCFDDALSLFSSSEDNSIICQSFVQDRWLGRGNLLNAQLITSLPAAILNNVSFKAVFRCSDLVQAERAAEFLGLPKDNGSIIQSLPDRQCYVWASGFETPIRIKTPDLPLDPTPQQAVLDRVMNPILEDLEKRLILSPPFEDQIEPICYLDDDDPPVSEDRTAEPPPMPDSPETIAVYVRFLVAVASNEHLSTRALNAALGLSAGKSARLKAELQANGYISVRKEPGATGRPRLVVQLTPQGAQMLEKWSTPS